MTETPTLWYFADPMCSWCYGFTPVIDAVRAAADDRYRVALILGGLRPGTTEPMSTSQREEILHHWQAVHERTGQPFAFEHAMPEGFVYDTEPASRAVVSIGELKQAVLFDYFKSVQRAFYVLQRDVTQTAVLMELAKQLAIEADDFTRVFESETAQHKTRQHFMMARQVGVRGFPTLILQRAQTFRLIASGYRTSNEIMPELESVLAT